MPTTGTVVRIPWTILDLDSSPLTGMTSPADVTFTLHRDNGTAIVAASETVTLTEVGVSGTYEIEFTPANTGLYVLQLKELNASTLQRTWRFPDYLILSAGSILSPSYANAFCSESDIERRLGLPISASTVPDDTAATAFAEGRAAYLMSLCSRLGFSVTPSTVTSGSVIQDLLREANAIGAAIDYLIAQGAYVTPMEPGKLGSLKEEWDKLVGYWNPEGVWINGYLGLEVKGNQVSLTTSHVLSGDTAARTDDSGTQDVGFQVRMSDVY